MKHLTAFALGLVTLAGCTLGPDYRRPVVEAPKAFQYEPKDAAATADTRGGSSSVTRCWTS